MIRDFAQKFRKLKLLQQNSLCLAPPIRDNIKRPPQLNHNEGGGDHLPRRGGVIGFRRMWYLETLTFFSLVALFAAESGCDKVSDTIRFDFCGQWLGPSGQVWSLSTCQSSTGWIRRFKDEKIFFFFLSESAKVRTPQNTPFLLAKPIPDINSRTLSSDEVWRHPCRPYRLINFALLFFVRS